MNDNEQDCITSFIMRKIVILGRPFSAEARLGETLLKGAGIHRQRDLFQDRVVELLH